MSSPEPILQKADFGDIYVQPDPRAYFATLSGYDYQIPQEGAEVFRRLLAACASPDHVPTILDVCCSYGIVSTLLKTGLDMSDVYAHYARPEIVAMATEDLQRADAAFLAAHRRQQDLRVIGLDIAESAVDYAVATGSLDVGFVEDLEREDPSPGLAEVMAEVDLITTTGGIGYVTERTFQRLVDVAGPSTQVAAFCLRTYDYGPIAHALAAKGLVTETFTRTFRQRRFVDADEQSWAVDRVRSLGLDPAGKEADGCYHADFFLSRPAEEIAARPLATLLATLPEL